jgi:nitroreductase
MWLADAPLTMFIAAAHQRTASKYGKRGIKYSLIEAGHIGQNIFFQVQFLDMEAGIVGAFHDAELLDALGTPAEHQPILLVPVGYSA